MALVLEAKNKFGRVKVLGIVNISPESFSYAYDPDTNCFDQKVLSIATELLNVGVDALDIGAVSTRPNSSLIDEALELKRYQEFLPRLLTAHSSAQISLDCFRHPVLKPLLAAHSVAYINDVSGFTNPHLVRLVAECDAKAIVMHSSGGLPALANVPDDYYADGLYDDMARFFSASLALAAEHGVDTNRLILDPGLGFAKNLKHSLEIVALIPRLRAELGMPILIGASRKSFLMRWFEKAVSRLGARDYKHGLLSALLEIAEEESGLSLDQDLIAADFFRQFPPVDTEPDELELRDKLSYLYNRLAIDAGAEYLRVHSEKTISVG